MPSQPVRRIRLRRIALVLACGGGLAAGFTVGMISGVDQHALETVPVAKELRFSRTSSDSVHLDKNWGTREVWGAWMSGTSAALMLGFDGPAEGDVELLVEGRVRPGPESDNAEVIIRYNDAELGRWRISPKLPQLRRRFIVPGEVFNRSTLGTLSFVTNGKGNAGFGLEGISMRDVRPLAQFRGFVDHCAPDKLGGWAVGENVPVTVVASVDGAPLQAVFQNVGRPDLQSHGFPVDAGFEIRPAEPIAVGSRVEVRFPNGRHLNGSPCQP